MIHSGLADSPLFVENKNQNNMDDSPKNENPIDHNHHQSTMPPCNHNTNIEMVRKAVKNIGKEAATYRLTKKEKQDLLEIIFNYRSKGYKISENEIARISLNYCINDFQSDPLKSILNDVIEALRQ
jgi:hypothetical protein